MRMTDRQREAAPYLVLAIAVFTAYANVYANQFLLDDIVLIVKNEFLRDWNHLPDLLTGQVFGEGNNSAFRRPLPPVIYFFVYQAFGLSLTAFHALNVLLQAVNAGLVYRLGRCFGMRLGVAFSAALLWSIHPLWTEAVTYASSTPELLYSFFCLVGILVLFPDFAPRRFWLAGVFFVLAILCKETAVVFPALAAFTLFLAGRDRLRPSTYIRTWPLWLLLAAYIIFYLYPYLDYVAFRDQNDVSFDMLYGHNPINRILTSLATLPTYFAMIVRPACLHMEWSFPIFSSLWSWPVLLGVAMVVAALLQIIWGRGRRGLALSWGFLWFAAAHSPNTGILKPLYAIVSEHWMYLPTIGLFLGTAQTLSVWIDKQKSERVTHIAVALVMLAALFLGVKTYLQNRVWHDTVSFYEHILDCGSKSGAVHNILGRHYFEHGEYEKAAEHFRAEIAHPAPLRIALTSSAHIRLAYIYLGVRPDENGVITFQAFTSVLPLSPHLPEAIRELEKALEVAPADDIDANTARELLSIIHDFQMSRGEHAAD